MTYEIALGDRSYSSWSMRIGLLVDRFALPVTCRFGRLYSDDFTRLLADFAPARTVPALRLPSGTVIAESLAIAEELAARFPGAGLWPADPEARAVARALAAEMHAGFVALRSACPMNLRVAYRGVALDPPVLADLARIEAIWDWARRATGRQPVQRNGIAPARLPARPQHRLVIAGQQAFGLAGMAFDPVRLESLQQPLALVCIAGVGQAAHLRTNRCEHRPRLLAALQPGRPGFAHSVRRHPRHR